MAVEWLEAHHYSNILNPEKAPFETQLSHSFSDRKAALAVANGAAEYLMFPAPVFGVQFQRTVSPSQAFVIQSQVIVD